MSLYWFTCYLILTPPKSKVKLREPENVILPLLAILLLFPVLPLSCFNCDLDQRTISNYLEFYIHLKEMNADLRQMIWDFFFFFFFLFGLFSSSLETWHCDTSGWGRDGYWTDGLVKCLSRLNQKNRESRKKSISAGNSE